MGDCPRHGDLATAASYDREINPGAAAWFKTTSPHLIDRITGYLAVLDAHGVRWRRLDSDAPGLVYEDADQIVVVPHSAAALDR